MKTLHVKCISNFSIWGTDKIEPCRFKVNRMEVFFIEQNVVMQHAFVMMIDRQYEREGGEVPNLKRSLAFLNAMETLIE